MKRTFLAAIGDANDVRTWSGIPYHEVQAGQRQGVIDCGLPLSVEGWRWDVRRYAWNLASILRFRGRGGYQYSVEFLERLWAPWRDALGGGRVINCFPLYPPSLVADDAVELWFHLDQTLLQLFDGYGIRQLIGPRIAAEALERERMGYERAAGILMHSRWAADSVIRDYGIASEKVKVVVPGANLDPGAYALWAHNYLRVSRKQDSPLRLVFVGKHPQRKGLDRLLRALGIARGQGANLMLRIIGCTPSDVPVSLRETPGIDWVGFIDKRCHAVDYLNSVGECDVGCLLSRAEAGGIGLREYHALGLAVIGPDVGGSPDHALPAAAIMVPPQADDRVIADLLVELSMDRDRIERMKAASWNQRHQVLWSATMDHIGDCLASVGA